MDTTVRNFDPRQVMHNNTFEVFHYKGLLPYDIEVHHHDFYEVYLFLNGSAEYWIEGKRITMNPGDFILLNPSELHRSIVLPNATDYERIVLWINKDWLNSISPENCNLSRCFDPTLPSHKNRLRPTNIHKCPCSEKLHKLVEEYYSDLWGKEEYLKAVFIQFMIELNRLSDQAGTKNKKDEDSDFIQQVLVYINENYNKNLSLDEISSRFFVSKYHLSHVFRREVGVSVYRYVTIKRLIASKKMLEEGLSAGETAWACGFSDYTSFYRAFKSEYGISPKEFVIG